VIKRRPHSQINQAFVLFAGKLRRSQSFLEQLAKFFVYIRILGVVRRSDVSLCRKSLPFGSTTHCAVVWNLDPQLECGGACSLQDVLKDLLTPGPWPQGFYPSYQVQHCQEIFHTQHQLTLPLDSSPQNVHQPTQICKSIRDRAPIG
jgi:hypothetical protein